jgi:hypothetical protein
MLRKLFIVAVLAFAPASIRASIVLDEAFNYPDGAVVTAPGTLWTTHSGSVTGQVDVASGKLNLTGAETEDVNALLQGQPYSTNSTDSLYAKFTVNFSALPSGASGGYFAHFMVGSSTFRAKVFATTNAAAAGLFRLGISSGSNLATNTFPQDLNPNQDHTVVIRLALNTAASTLWINPTAETDSSVNAADTFTPINVASFAFRQTSGIGTLTVDDLVVGTSFADVVNAIVVPQPLAIAMQPSNQDVFEGGNALFMVQAVGTPPLLYQWQKGDTDIVNATNATLTLTNVTTSQAGAYRVIVSNSAGFTNSTDAILTVTIPTPPAVTSIADLRKLVDPVNYLPTDTNTIFTAEGIVTTSVNLTTGTANVSFYMQDASAGICVFWTGGASQFMPQAGDRVRVAGPLTHYNGLLELYPYTTKTGHSVTLISTNNPLPAPTPLVFSWQSDPAVIEAQEGKYMVASNVFLDLTSANFSSATAGRNQTITNEAGETFVLFVNAQTDLDGQAKPTGPVTLYGVLSQFDSTDPRTSAYQIIPSRFADIVSATKAATVRFTNYLENLVRPGDQPVNTFAEQSLRPGEKLTIVAKVSDANGKEVTLTTPTATFAIERSMDGQRQQGHEPDSDPGVSTGGR